MLVIIYIINTMQLVYRLLQHSFDHRMRVLSIDQRFTEDDLLFVTLFEEHRLDLAKRKVASD